MKLSLSREKIASVARLWEKQYADTKDAAKRAITEQLNKIDPATTTAAEVKAIIGNGSWSYFRCDECDQEVEQAVTFTREYGDDHMTFCPSCLRAAAALACVKLS